jgi:hypothetical protein
VESKHKFYRCVFEIEVLSEDPISEMDAAVTLNSSVWTRPATT